MKVIYEYDIDTELRRILFGAENIKGLFFQEHSFAVLPYLEESNPHCVYFPNLEYNKIPGFWDAIPAKQLNKHADLVLDIPQKIEKDLKTRLSPIINDKKLIIQEVELKWGKKQSRFLSILDNLFDLNNTQIIIRPTNFGTFSSYFPQTKNSEKLLYVYYRVDCEISFLAEVIITSLLYLNLIDKTPNTLEQWIKVETATDTLMQHTKLRDLFPNYKPTREIWEKPLKNKKIWNDHKKYIKSLGFPLQIDVKMNSNKLIINQREINLNEFTQDQKIIIKTLFENKNEIVTFEELGQQIWAGDFSEKFSLWALAKKIERIRKTLKEHEIFFEVVETHRGRGYRLRGQH